MSYTNAVSERMEDLRFRNGQSQRNEFPMSGLYPMAKNGGTNQLPLPLSMLNDSRGNLTRRFTTDSARIPTLGSLAVQKRSADSQDYTQPSSTQFKVQLLEKKKLEYERLKEQKRRFTAEMRLLDLQQRQDERELAQMQDDLSRVKITSSGVLAAGHQSEPSTPPEYLDSSSGFPSAFSRPNRYSASSLTSPLGLYSRPIRAGSQLVSPSSGLSMPRYARDEVLARSVPGSRRNSDEEEKEEAVRQDPSSHRAANGKNRYSMPVGHSRAVNEMLSQKNKNKNTNHPHDSEMTSHMDSQVASTSNEGATNLGSNNILTYANHRGKQQGIGSTGSVTRESPLDFNHQQALRNSLDYKQYSEQPKVSPNLKTLPLAPPKLMSSFSTNDIPTVKTASFHMATIDPNARAQQHFRNHNATLGRIPASSTQNRLSRDIGSDTLPRDVGTPIHTSNHSALQASAPSFGPSYVQVQTQPAHAQSASSIGSYGETGGYSYAGYQIGQEQPYDVQLYSNGAQRFGTGNLSMLQNPYSYSGTHKHLDHSISHNAHMLRDSQAQVIQQRRKLDGEAMNRYLNRTVEDFRGQIYSLCKDQHGCRFLQRQLEERTANRVHMIWLETNQHVTELMTDPFGNYLCQKLLEYSNDEQRTILVENASHDLVRIALNQHGTRALQKMIEFMSTPRQVHIVIQALRTQVVDLIQDLNGNHVIQKCLNKFTPRDAQFIFDAVGNSCTDVGTHRHGCCVLQRCIDHAVGDQKAWLIRQISDNAYRLVQDPFGNYVIQYILDLNEPAYTEPLVMMFKGNVCALSRHKFSSNVIEKCLRCAQEPAKEMLVEEMLRPAEIAKLVRDPFSNYVIQTALDYSKPVTRQRLVDAIRPVLPEIRSTPYGRRILSKITSLDSRVPASIDSKDPAEGSKHRVLASSVANTGAFVQNNNTSRTDYGEDSTSTDLPTADQIAARSLQQLMEHHHVSPAYNNTYEDQAVESFGNYI